MRRIVWALGVAFFLSGCASTLEGAYDEHARGECDGETAVSERGVCHDRVEQNRRENR